MCSDNSWGINLANNSAGNVYSNNRLTGNTTNYFGTLNISAGSNNAGGANF